ncbi:hypothetical protein BDZ94DRAFT_1299100 [Collybia nuda]|uniref:Uncharacterized protein n=1 Tax=Collybia nuda TaxID=64659 RepID=A0A9P5Y3I1_9AGAR|nr:hypothetical protein BDZ94DRAFT_1299100 [Collybia nuda]
MLFHSTSILSLLALALSAAAVNCGVCAPTIFFQGQTRTLTLTSQRSGNQVQCNYDSPPIPGFSPGCLYRNIDGQITFTNTGPTLWSLPGACPNPITVISKTSC